MWSIPRSTRYQPLLAPLARGHPPRQFGFTAIFCNDLHRERQGSRPPRRRARGTRRQLRHGPPLRPSAGRDDAVNALLDGLAAAQRQAIRTLSPTANGAAPRAATTMWDELMHGRLPARPRRLPVARTFHQSVDPPVFDAARGQLRGEAIDVTYWMSAGLFLGGLPPTPCFVGAAGDSTGWSSRAQCEQAGRGQCEQLPRSG